MNLGKVNLKCLEDNLIRFGIYADHLKKWFKYFPKKRFLILKSQARGIFDGWQGESLKKFDKQKSFLYFEH